MNAMGQDAVKGENPGSCAVLSEPTKQGHFGVIVPDPLAAHNLERMISSRVEVIAIDDTSPLGPAAARTVQFGNMLHKSAVLSAVSTALCAPIPSNTVHKAMVGFCAASVGSAALYALLWQFDPLCKYQVDGRGESATELPTEVLRPGSSYILFVRKDDAARKVVHYSLAALSVGLCMRYAPEQLTAATDAAKLAVVGFTSRLL
eukprot:m.97443 g.97443  ORF g.97443 m.97443 type:complete len:204 (+) comp20529_c0_seq1:32-643(+)